MKDIMQKLAELEATAPKVTKKKMLNEDSTTPPMNVSNKIASLKDMFEALSESIPAGAKPLPVLDPQNKQAGMGFVTSNNPAVQNMLKALDPKDVQIVQAPGQPGQPQVGQQQQTGQPAQAGATGQPQAGQMQMKEKDEGKPGKNFAKIAKSAGERYGSKEAGERVAGAVRAKLAKQGKLEEEQLDELSPELLGRAGAEAKRRQQAAADVLPLSDEEFPYISVTNNASDFPVTLRSVKNAVRAISTGELTPDSKVTVVRGHGEREGYFAKDVPELKGLFKPENPASKFFGQKADKFGQAAKAATSRDQNKDQYARQTANMSPAQKRQFDAMNKSGDLAEGAKVDRMVKHIEKSEKKLGKSKEKASDIAWATANKRGMLDNKNKKVKEGDIPSSSGVDTKGAGLGAGRSATTLEGKKPDFLDLDKDGNKKEPMKKAAADKKKKKVDESMNHRISAARLEGKSHGLRGHAHSGKRYEDLDEIKAYHEGYKEGLDECYGQGVYETAPAMPAATVGGMADEEMLGELSPQTLQRAAGAARARGRWAASVDRQVGSTAHKNLAAKDMALAKKADAKAGVTDPTSPNPSYDWANKGGYGMDNDPALKPKYQSGMAEEEMEEGNAFTAALAKTPKGGKFSVGGKTFTDRTGYDAKVNEYAFESWDRELNALLTESEEVTEGLSVSISKGQQNSPDSVTITAQDQEAEHLLAFVKNAGLGLFGDDNADTHSSAMSVQPSHGAPDEVGAGGIDIGVVDGHDGMMGLMQKLSGIQSGGADDYADEEGEEQLYGNDEAADKKDCGCDGDCECSDYDKPSNEGMCNECGTSESVHEAGCSKGREKEMVDEVESEDQMEFEVAEDNAPDSGEAESTADENAEASEDMALAKAGSKGGTYTVNEDGDEASEEGPESKEGEGDEGAETVSESFANLFRKLSFIAEESTEKEDDKAEKAGKKVAKDIEHDEGHKGKDDDKAEKAGKKVTKDIEYDDKKDKKEKVDEWANNAGPGKTVSDTTFEQDIDFMTKVIAGGLNKPKSTGQTTIPVIAGQDDRMHDNPMDWATLAGIKK
jgi:hypothetical protein